MGACTAKIQKEHSYQTIKEEKCALDGMWMKLKRLDAHRDDCKTEQIIVINNNQFIACSWFTDYLQTYNMMTDEWISSIKFSAQHKRACVKSYNFPHTVSVDKENEIVYLFCSSSMDMIKYDVTKRFFETHSLLEIENSNCMISKVTPSTNIKEWKMWSCQSLFVDDNIHIIGAAYHKCLVHIIYDVKTKIFKHIHTFTHYPFGIGGYGFCYIKSQNILLLFGGHETGGHYENTDDIWRYSLIHKKWIVLKDGSKLPLKMSCFGSIITPKEKYIILFGGYLDVPDPSNKIDDIFILDITKRPIEWNKISLNCPQNGIFCAVSTPSEMFKYNILLCGYIREIFGGDSFITDDLVKLISLCLELDFVHLMDRENGQHWKISLSHLMIEAINI